MVLNLPKVVSQGPERIPEALTRAFLFHP